MYNKKDLTFLTHLSDDAYFGEISFFTGQGRLVSARTVDFTEILYIKSQEFLECASVYSNCIELFHQIKDDIE